MVIYWPPQVTIAAKAVGESALASRVDSSFFCSSAWCSRSLPRISSPIHLLHGQTFLQRLPDPDGRRRSCRRVGSLKNTKKIPWQANLIGHESLLQYRHGWFNWSELEPDRSMYSATAARIWGCLELVTRMWVFINS